MTRPPPLLLALSLAGALFAAAAPAPAPYQDAAALTRSLKSLARAHDKLVRLRELTESPKDRPVWLVEVGTGKEDQRNERPALLVVAGAEAHDLAGTAITLHWLEHIAHAHATTDAIKKLLDTTTLYVVPRLNPDGAELHFQKPREERLVRGAPVDDDHDGLSDEDGPEDLNDDGRITSMRVADPAGDFFLDPTDPRLLIRADRTKGETGGWKLLSEGKDNDHDEAWNEDGPGGTNPNRNFPFQFRYFGPDAGRHPVSEVETRALTEFVIAHPNIGIVFTFGAADNLSQPPKSEAGGKRPPTAIQDGDLPYYRELGKAWREAIGLKKELPGASEPGTVSDWAYFQRGRLSLAARPWFPALQLELAKEKSPDKKEAEKGANGESTKEGDKDGATPADAPKPQTSEAKDKPDPGKEAQKPAEEKKGDKKEKKPEPDKRNEEERDYLKWADTHHPELFVPWKTFDHSDFAGQKVEIGGWSPYARSVPPPDALPRLKEQQAQFLTALAGKLPRLNVRQVKLKHLGASVYDLTVQIENTGYLPTSLAQGETTREVLPTRIELQINADVILSGTRRARLGIIPGSGGMQEARWVFLAKERRQVEVVVTSALAGTLRHTVELKETP